MNSDIEAQLFACERRLGVRLCIIDHHGSLHRERGTVLDIRWQSHRSATVCDLGFGPPCIAHCRSQVNRRLERDPRPYVTRCWKGLREIAVPIRWEGHHLATLYAGTWRQSTPPATAATLPDQWLAHWRALPVWNETASEGLREVILLLADGLSHRLTTVMIPQSTQHNHSDREARIHRFVHLHGHLPVTIGDLARDLHLSPSRCAAVVRQYCGNSFALILRRHRIERACHLLRTSDDKIQTIAMQVGIEDPLYFSRCFRQQIGCSPRDYRRKAKV